MERDLVQYMTPKGNNALLTVTDHFSKYVKVVPGNESMKAEEWAALYWRHVVKDGGTPAKLISDREPKFTGDFWRTIFSQCGVTLGMTAAYHPSAEGQVSTAS